MGRLMLIAIGIILIDIAIEANLGSMLGALILPSYMVQVQPGTGPSGLHGNAASSIINTAIAGIGSAIGGTFTNPGS